MTIWVLVISTALQTGVVTVDLNPYASEADCLEAQRSTIYEAFWAPRVGRPAARSRNPITGQGHGHCH